MPHRGQAWMLGVLASLIPCSPAAAGTYLGPGLTINDSLTPPTVAAPYPSTVTVSGEQPIVTSVRVRVFGFTHTAPEDVDLLLVGPRGQSVMLMSDAGEGTPETNEGFTVNDTGPPLGLSIGGTFPPTDVDEPGDDEDAFPGPAPAGPYGSSLNALARETANGTWRLYAVDDFEDDVGSIGGWELRITSRDPATLGLFTPLPPPFGFPENVGSVRVTVERGFTAGLRAGSVAYTTSPFVNGPVPGADYTPRNGRLEWAAGASGPRIIDIPILDDRVSERQECILFSLRDASGDAALSRTPSQAICIADNEPILLPPLVAELAGARVQRPLRQRGVTVRVTPSLAGIVTATGRITVPSGAAAVVRLRRARRDVRAGQQVRLKLRLSRSGMRTVRRALRTQKRLRARLTVTLDGTYGRTTTARRTVRLRR